MRARNRLRSLGGLFSALHRGRGAPLREVEEEAEGEAAEEREGGGTRSVWRW